MRKGDAAGAPAGPADGADAVEGDAEAGGGISGAGAIVADFLGVASAGACANIVKFWAKKR